MSSTAVAPAVASPDARRDVSLPGDPPVVGRGRERRTLLLAVGRRLLGTAVVLWATISAAFLALQLAPGDPATVLLGTQSRSPEAIAAVTEEWGLDRPVWQQYLDYLGGALRGDFGMSYVLHRPVSEVIWSQLGATALLTFSGMLVAIVLAVIVAVATARRRIGSRIAGSIEVVTSSIPDFWLALVLLAVFSFALGWFPVAGGDGFRSLVLPALALGIGIFGLLSQVLREALERALDQPFALTVRSRGVRDLTLRLRHGLRHAAVPVVTLTGYLVGALLGGAIIIEQVFGRPGIGQIALNAVAQKDLPLVLGVALVGAFAYVAASTAVDLASLAIDPRLRQQPRRTA